VSIPNKSPLAKQLLNNHGSDSRNLLEVIDLHENTALTISPHLKKVRKWTNHFGGSFPLQNIGEALPMASPMLKVPTTMTGIHGLLAGVRKVQS